MQLPSQFKNRIDLYGCSAVSRQQRKFSEFWGYFLPWYRICPNLKVKLEATGVENPKMQFPSQCKKRSDRNGLQTNPCHVAPYRASNENFQNFGATFYHGIVFAPMQSLYCKEATGVENSKMQFLSECKNRADRYRSRNYPVSCSTVLGKE